MTRTCTATGKMLENPATPPVDAAPPPAENIEPTEADDHGDHDHPLP